MKKLAVMGGPKTKTKPFPSWPIYDEDEADCLLEVLKSRHWWRTPGTKTLEFEQAFAQFHQAEYGVAVTNGTHALEIVLCALGITFGDEVILPDFTFVATASSVLSVGALPVFVDIQDGTYCIDPALVEQAISPRTKAIIAVHMGGHPADLDCLVEISKKHGITLIEDSAHSHGSEWRGKRVGTFGIAGTFSFQASKLMTAGEGGIIITNDKDFEARARSAHDCGRLSGKWFYDHFDYGSNYRLSEWQSAILTVQLQRLRKQRELRFKNACLLNKLLNEFKGITPQTLDKRCTHNGHYAYIFHYDKSAFADLPRQYFIDALRAEGIPEQASYPPLHTLDLFNGGYYKKRLSPNDSEGVNRLEAQLRNPYPITTKASYETVWIPHYALLGDNQDIEDIVQAIKKIQKQASELKQFVCSRIKSF